MIRSATLGDTGRTAALLTTIFDDRIITAAGMRYAWESAPPEDRRAQWVAQRFSTSRAWRCLRDAFRGRGIGLLMKQVSLNRAAAAGITRVITQNDDTNAPMIAINARLGYRPFSSGHSWVLEREVRPSS